MIKNECWSSSKLPVILVDFKDSNFSRDFRNILNIKFRENPSSGSRVVPCGQTDGRTNMAKLIVASRNFAKALSNRMVHGEECRRTSSRPTEGAVPEFSGQTFSVRKLNLGIRITKQNYEPLNSHVRSSRAVGHISCSSV